MSVNFMHSHDFLLELLTEEIPYLEQQGAKVNIQNAITKHLALCNVEYQTLQVYTTPRRLVVIIKGISHTTKPYQEVVKGPVIDANDKAKHGFCQHYNINYQDLIALCNDSQAKKLLTSDHLQDTYLTITDIHNKQYYTLQYCYKPLIVADLLPELLQEKILPAIVFQRSMHFNIVNFYYSRPMVNILAMLDDQLIKLNFGGASSQSFTYGHQILAPQKLPIKNVNTYIATLQQAYVIVDQQHRYQLIVDYLHQVAEQYQLIYDQDNKLIDEIVHLVEYPSCLLACIPQKFMHLPDELLIEIIKNNQKYINFLQNIDGALSPYYVIVTNMDLTNASVHDNILKGNQKVLESRLMDGSFFYQQDQQKTLIEQSKGLADIVFFEQLGSILDKTVRVAQLFYQLWPQENVNEKLFQIYKADLNTKIVEEFPQLQGIIGYYYALHQGYDHQLALAVKDHYKPTGVTDNMPTSLLAGKLALSDKLDTLIEFFRIKQKPTGNKDPYALRRCALGIIKIIIHYQLDVSLDFLSDDLKEFFVDRFIIYSKKQWYLIKDPKMILSKDEYRYDVSNLNILQLYKILLFYHQELKYWRGDLLNTCHRVANLLSQHSLCNQHADLQELDDTILSLELDQQLLLKVKEWNKILNTNVLDESPIGHYVDIVNEYRQLIEYYLDHTFINTDDQALKTARLVVLSVINSHFVSLRQLIVKDLLYNNQYNSSDKN